MIQDSKKLHKAAPFIDIIPSWGSDPRCTLRDPHRGQNVCTSTDDRGL